MAEPIKKGPIPIPEEIDDEFWQLNKLPPATSATMQGKTVHEQSVEPLYSKETAGSRPKKRKLSGLKVLHPSPSIDYKEEAARYAKASDTDGDGKTLPDSFLEDFWSLNTSDHPDYGSALVFLCMDFQLHKLADDDLKDILVEAIKRAGTDKVSCPEPLLTEDDDMDKGSGDSRLPDSRTLADKLIASLSQSSKKIIAATDLDEIVKGVFPEKREEVLVEFMKLHHEHRLMKGIQGQDSESEDSDSDEDEYGSEEVTPSQPGYSSRE